MSKAYYNENDPFAAQWLRNLIDAGLIMAGEVDDRSIEDVQPSDLDGFTQHHFFAGIGGWSYALRLAGWPDNRPAATGSCPCQPFSSAGKRKGTDDDRHLWPAFRWLVAQRQFPVVFGEQVASSDGREWLAGVRADLEAMGYDFGAADLCAASVGAPHIRHRLWWVADAERGAAERYGYEVGGSSGGLQKEARKQRIRPNAGDGCTVVGLGNPDQGIGRQGNSREQKHLHTPAADWTNYTTIACGDGRYRRIEPSITPLVDGLPGRMGRLRGYGNAIVPQVAAEFIQAYMECAND